MKYQLTKISLISFLIMFSLIVGFENNIVEASSESTNFEDGTVDQLYSNSWYSTTDNTSLGLVRFCLKDSIAYMDHKAFHQYTQAAPKAWGTYNFTYAAGYYMTYFSVYTTCYGSGANFYFYKEGIQYKPIVDVYYHDTITSLSYLYVTDNTGASQTLHFDSGKKPRTDFNRWGFYTVDEGNASVDIRYWVDDPTSGNYTIMKACHPSGFDRIDFYSVYSGVNVYTFQDNINVVFDDVEEYSGGATTYCNTSGYNSVGNPLVSSDSRRIIGNRYLEHRYWIKKSATIKAYDLKVTNDQHTHAGSLSSYNLWIDDTNMEEPDYWVELDDGYLLQWCGLDYTVNNEYLDFEIYNSQVLFGSTYWEIFYHDVDIDDDGSIRTYYHNKPFLQDGNAISPTWINKELAYKCYFEDVEYIEPETYLDVIDTDKNEYDQYEQVFIGGTVSTTLNQNYIVVESGATEYENITLESSTISHMFTPTVSGSYTARIWRDGSNPASCTFTVNAVTDGYYIYTDPSITKPQEKLTCHFGYNSSNLICAILLYKEGEEAPIEDPWVYNVYPVNDSFTYHINEEGVYYFRLCSYQFLDGVSRFSTIRETKHICKEQYQNRISVVYLSFDVDWTERRQRFDGSHNYFGNNVYIDLNGIHQIHVGDASTFRKYWRPILPMEYNAVLTLKLSDESIPLANVTFKAYSSQEQGEDTGDFGEGLLPAITGTLGIILALFIIILSTLAPLLVASALRLYVEIPFAVYGLCSSVGIIACAILGWIPMWAIYFIMVVAITITILMYIQRS